MRRRSWSAAIALGLACLVAPAPARASEAVWEVGLRVGYAVGLGWTAGPLVGASIAGQPFEFLWQERAAMLGGIVASGDVVLAPSGDVSFRAHVGPELGAVKACPGLEAKLGAGIGWIMRRGRPTQMGFEGGGAFLGSISEARSSMLFLGAGFRYGETLAGARTYDVDLEIRRMSMPFDSSLLFSMSFCSAFGGEPARPFAPGPLG